LSLALLRGGVPADLVLAWRGEVHSTYDPFELHLAPPQIIIGAQTLHAVGYAMGIQRDGGDQVAVAYFGDGASSQGDVNEAMVFASSFTARRLRLLQQPVGDLRTGHGAVALPDRGSRPGFGIPSMRVDGNDVLACTAAMRWALDHARRGEVPCSSRP
jgi:pyruvate dehydrogenase E1 component alpha subunit